MKLKEEFDKLLKFLNEDDGTFFDQMLEQLTDEELTKFLENNPDFLATS